MQVEAGKPSPYPIGAVDVDAARVEHPNRLLHVAAHRSRMKPLVEARRHLRNRQTG